jgi:hypothetical protein
VPTQRLVPRKLVPTKAADVANDPDRLRENAWSHSQADVLSDYDQHAEHPRSTVTSREILRHGGSQAYRANRADRRAWERALRPKP